MTTAVIVAAGHGSRMGSTPDKVFLNLGSKPVLAHALAPFEGCSDIDEIILVVRKEQLSAAHGLVQMFGCRKVRQIVCGGKTRFASVKAGVEAANPDCRIITIHDGARPCVTSSLISATIESAKKYGSGVAATKIVDAVKSASRACVVEKSIDRDTLWTVQTPQSFKASILRKSIAAAAAEGVADHPEVAVDDSAVVAAAGFEIRLVQSPSPNLKITVPDDLVPAARLLGISGV